MRTSLLITKWVLCAAIGLAFTAAGQVWTLTSAPATNWTCLASSADGQKIVAGASPGLVYLSTDAGSTWNPTTLPNSTWVTLACSADASVILASSTFAGGNGASYVSTNSGATWDTNTTGSLPNRWASATVSGDGHRRVGFSGSSVIYSTNSGVDWSQSFINSSKAFHALYISGSSDGSRVVGTWENSSLSTSFFTYTNLGAVAASLVGPSVGNARFVKVAVSANGNTWAAPLSPWSSSANAIYSTTNAGVNWTTANLPSNDWQGITLSADGSRMAAAASNSFGGGGLIYTSADSGVTWATSDAPATNWSAIASSADGNLLVAAVNSGPIYVWQNTPTPLLNTTCPDSSNVLVSWTVPSASFVLQQNTNLTTTNWAEVVTPAFLNYSNLNYEVTVPAAPGAVFYRLKLQP